LEAEIALFREKDVELERQVVEADTKNLSLENEVIQLQAVVGKHFEREGPECHNTENPLQAHLQ
jgi:hypothetical protein